jgi:hypothetical protein
MVVDAGNGAAAVVAALLLLLMLPLLSLIPLLMVADADDGLNEGLREVHGVDVDDGENNWKR